MGATDASTPACVHPEARRDDIRDRFRDCFAVFPMHGVQLGSI